MHGHAQGPAVCACRRASRTFRRTRSHTPPPRWVALCIWAAVPLVSRGAETGLVASGSIPGHSRSINSRRTGPQPLLERAPELPIGARTADCPDCQRLERPRYIVPEATGPRIRRDKQPEVRIRRAGSPDSVPSPSTYGTDGPLPLAPADLRVWRTSNVSFAFPAPPPPPIPPSQHSTTNEPSFGVNQDVIFTTGNWYAAISPDLGATWQFVNPYDNFPADGTYDTPAGSYFCCDQIAYYERSRDVMCWLLQYSRTDPAGNVIQNVQRLAWAVGRQELLDNNWGFVDFNPTDFGLAANTFWLDFPDLQVTSNNLCLTTNVFRLDGATVNLAVFVAVPLNALSTGGPFTYTYSTSSVNSIRMCSGCTDTMYFATHIDTDTLRIHRWPEGSPSVLFDDADHDAFNSTVGGQMIATGPDGTNWAGFCDNRVLGAYRAGGELGFLYGSRQDPGNGRPFPYVDVARFWESDRSHLATNSLFSTEVGILYPAVHVNARGDRGGVLAFGGGAFHPGIGVFVVDEFNGFNFDGLEVDFVSTGNAGPASNRWGDYFTSRQSWLDPYTWHAAGHLLLNATTVQPLNIWFSRERDTPPGEISATNLTIAGGRCHQVGSTPMITATLFNLGMTSIDVPLVQFRLSTDATIDISDVLLGEVANTVVGASSTVQVAVTPAIPNLPVGQYYLGVMTPFLADELPHNNYRVLPQTLGIDAAPGPAPVITAPAAEYACELQSLLVDVSVRSALPITQYVWTKNGMHHSNPSPAGDPDLGFFSAQPDDSGFYQLTAISDCGLSMSQNIIVAVNVWFRQHPVSVSVNPCDAATFSVEAYGLPTLNYQWQRDGVNLTNDGRITGANAASLHIAAARYEDEGTYRCVVTNPCGSFSSSPATLTIPLTPIWQLRSPASAPIIRSDCDMAYDAHRGVCVLYGGYYSTYLTDTWEWDGVEWVQRNPAHTPGRRSGHAMTYDSDLKRVVLYGGFQSEIGKPAWPSDLWAYDGDDWVQLVGPSDIPPRESPYPTTTPELTYDSTRKRIILVRNQQNTVSNSETYEFDPATSQWSLTVPNNGFTAGYGGAIGYDPGRIQVVHYYGNSGIFGVPKETWRYNGTSWTPDPATTPQMPFCFMQYDSTRRRNVIFFANYGSLSLYTVSYFDLGTDWGLLLANDVPNSPPAFRLFCQGMAYDSKRRAMVAVFADYYGAPNHPFITYEYRYLDQVVFDRHPQSQPLNPGGNVTFNVVAAGYGTLAYQWKRNGQNLADGPAPGGGSFAGTATPTLTLTGMQQADGGIYTCSVSNTCGGAISNGALLGTPVPPDLDTDGNVDGDDLDLFEACASGPGVPFAAGCGNRDFDNDGDADQTDFGMLQRCLSGEGVPADASCMN